MNYKFEFCEKKDLWLQENRNVSFQKVLDGISNGDLIAIVDTPDQIKHPSQMTYRHIQGSSATRLADLPRNTSAGVLNPRHFLG